MNRILLLENELKLSKINILKCQDSSDPTIQQEYRSFLIQRSNIKDMLIQEYRNELLEKRKDYEYVSED